jgi:AcrR family transcriptional regulator
MARKSTTPLRREPRQDRGRRRIDAILDAADAVIGEVGYEAATTNAIARRAETSVGSLYQFFADKEAILRALAARYLDKLRAVHDAVLNEETARLPWTEMYDRIVDALAEFHARHPGFRPLFHGSTTSAELARASAELDGECVRRADAMMAAGLPDLDPERRRLYAVLNVEVIKALLTVAESGDRAWRARVIAETKRMLHAHLRDAVADLPRRGRA